MKKKYISQKIEKIYRRYREKKRNEDSQQNR